MGRGTYDEHHARDGRRVGRPQISSPGAQWSRAVPLVQPGGSARPVYLLFPLLRARVEAADSTCLSARAGVSARQRDLRPVCSRYGRCCATTSIFARKAAQGVAAALGAAYPYPQKPVGCRPYSAGERRRRRMRPQQHPDALPALSSSCDGGTARTRAQANLEKRDARCVCGTWLLTALRRGVAGFRMGRSAFLNELDLEDLWPQLAGHKEAVVRGVVGDAVKDGIRGGVG